MRFLWTAIALLTSYLAVSNVVNLIRIGGNPSFYAVIWIFTALMAAAAVGSWRKAIRHWSRPAKSRENPFEARKRA